MPSLYYVITTKNTALRYHRLCALALQLLGRLHDDYVIAIFSVCLSFYIVINTKNTSGQALRYQRSCAPLLAGAAPCMALGRLHDDYVIAIFSVCFSCRH